MKSKWAFISLSKSFESRHVHKSLFNIFDRPVLAFVEPWWAEYDSYDMAHLQLESDSTKVCLA